MLVTDAQFNAAKGDVEEKKPSFWSKILFSLTSENEKDSSSVKEDMEHGEIYRIC